MVHRMERLTELLELARSLACSGGKGPLRKAPEEVYVGRVSVGWWGAVAHSVWCYPVHGAAAAFCMLEGPAFHWLLFNTESATSTYMCVHRAHCCFCRSSSRQGIHQALCDHRCNRRKSGA
jgi:hypothetical protein